MALGNLPSVRDLTQITVTESLRVIRQQAIDQAANGTGVILDVDFDSGPESFVYEDEPPTTRATPTARSSLALRRATILR